MEARQKKEEPPKGSPAWMSTFSDLMNLLLCFFVLLFSMSSVDAGKYAELVQSLNKSFNSSFSIFSNSHNDSVVDNSLFPKSVNQVETLDEVKEDTGEPTKEPVTEENFDAEAYIQQLDKEKVEELYEEITQMTEKKEIESKIDVAVDEQYQYVKLTLSGAVLFDSGKDTIKQDSYRILSRIGDILKNYEEHIINIEGHSDNQPINNGVFDDNMELSSARAYQVWKYMVDKKHLDPKSLKSAGRSEYEPVADNSTAEGRAKNRRVEFKIYTEVYNE